MVLLLTPRCVPLPSLQTTLLLVCISLGDMTHPPACRLCAVRLSALLLPYTPARGRGQVSDRPRRNYLWPRVQQGGRPVSPPAVLPPFFRTETAQAVSSSACVVLGLVNCSISGRRSGTSVSGGFQPPNPSSRSPLWRGERERWRD